MLRFVQDHAEPPDLLPVDVRQDGRDVDEQQPALAFHREGDRLSGPGPRERDESVEVPDRATVDGHHLVPLAEPGDRGRRGAAVELRLYLIDDGTVGRSNPDGHEEDGKEHDGHHEVSDGSRRDDYHPLPDRLRREGSKVLLRRDLLEGIHSGDADVPPEGQRLHAVFRLAATDGPQAWPEPDEELLDLDLEGFRREEVA